jgi:hypothetical protein
MELLHQGMLSQFMARKLTSERVAVKVLGSLVEEDEEAPTLASVVSVINKELEAMGMKVEFTDNAPGGEKHYAIVDTGTDPSPVSQLATTFSQPELEMFQKIVRRPAPLPLHPPPAHPLACLPACRADRPCRRKRRLPH